MIAPASPNDSWERALDAMVPKTATTQTALAKRIVLHTALEIGVSVISLPWGKLYADAVDFISLILLPVPAAGVRTIPVLRNFPVCCVPIPQARTC